MFTGIIEELAQIKKIKKNKNGRCYTITSKLVINDLGIGDSISVNGVCLTAIKINKNDFSVDLVEETLNKSNLGDLKMNDYVNLERAMKASGRFDGHIVQGHIETLGVILDHQGKGSDSRLSIGLDPEWMRYCIPKGSITIDGVSLTIAAISGNIVEVALIPHTLKNTTLGKKCKSETVNIETDIIGKYIDRLISFDGEDIEIDQNFLKVIRHIQYGES